ncbi:MAG TPA: bifunctional diaminohydroxyphosphoribosylaminopyrimidine deaminase/5-amino-6-(5-phosphoribosylamino)uracil reductase RibD [Candidatus Nitrosotalea sp.]|nr:bifunctional diaminohydroxyphosphoribosylaminopyrimidine deaminase/5-amino-6-(5-phosphoribosylamino)uracil reductase RibD [Candidatus Nitrosotalea sp.]
MMHDIRNDIRWMARALALAARGRGLTSPNPMVGAVVVRDDVIVAEGFHERAGGPHGEAAALSRAGDHARGATLYVTLEPCNHVGRTPPCVDAIVRAGIRRVVSAIRDPNPRVTGGGTDALVAAGIEVTNGVLEREARDLNRVFFTAIERQRPHVTMKWAMTLDGKIAAFDRTSRWITGEAARREAHRLRSQSDAIVTGIGTVLADDPALTVRLEQPWPREPYRVVLDSRARLPLDAAMLRSGSRGRILVAVGDDAPAPRVAALESVGVTVLQCKSREGRVDVSDVCARLHALDVTAVLLEAGSGLGGAFLEAGLVDRVAVFVAPMLLGGARAPGPTGGTGLTLGDAVRLTDLTTRPLGDDWLLEANVSRGERSA